MKTAIVYSSKTGNTRQIAYAIKDVMPADCEIFPIEQAPNPDDYDFICLGFWVDKGMPDAKSQVYMKTVKNKDVGLFMTLGAYPESDHADKSMQKAIDQLNDNKILGTFACQGKIDPALIEMMQQMTKNNPHHPHAMNDERKARHAEAQKHPNQQDCINAQKAFIDMLKK